MTIRKIARMGHEVLQKPSAPIDDPTAPEIAALARDLIETCEDIGGNGIAAPQVYEPKRMFVFRVRRGVMPAGATMQEIPWTVVINPTLSFLDQEQKLYWERCLSLPGLYGQVPRFTKLRMEAYGLDGEKYTMTTAYFLARLLQHEYDHLDGILYPMRMQDMANFGFVSERGPATYPTFPFDATDFVDPEIA
ncbi:MAG: peptide deformylase [Alphaproteobacteria bacterium]|nr:peptide deformylase [Alphaproteobacteria bacterium]